MTKREGQSHAGELVKVTYRIPRRAALALERERVRRIEAGAARRAVDRSDLVAEAILATFGKVRAK